MDALVSICPMPSNGFIKDYRLTLKATSLLRTYVRVLMFLFHGIVRGAHVLMPYALSHALSLSDMHVWMYEREGRLQRSVRQPSREK